MHLEHQAGGDEEGEGEGQEEGQGDHEQTHRPDQQADVAVMASQEGWVHTNSHQGDGEDGGHGGEHGLQAVGHRQLPAEEGPLDGQQPVHLEEDQREVMVDPEEEPKGMVGADVLTKIEKVPFCDEEHGVDQDCQYSGEVVDLDDVAGPEVGLVGGEGPVYGEGVAEGGQGQPSQGDQCAQGHHRGALVPTLALLPLLVYCSLASQPLILP